MAQEKQSKCPKRLSLWKRDSSCEQDAAPRAWCPCGLAEGRASYLDAAPVEPGVLAGGAHHGGVGEAVQPQLEDWVQFWAPQDRRAMGLLEGAQGMAAELVEGLEHLSSGESWREP